MTTPAVPSAGPPPQVALSLRGLTVRYGSGPDATTAVEAVDLDVLHGRVVGLVGESGSGKSTIARAVAGLVDVTAGRVTVAAGLAPATDRPSGRVQMVFQDPYSSLDPRLTIGRSIEEGVRAAGRIRPPQLRTQVARLLDLVALDPALATHRPAELSGGQRQRVAIARALGARPDVLVADEITSALDVSVQASVLNLIRGLNQQLGLSMLFISHNLAVVRYISDAVAVMYGGRIVEVGPTDAVVADPQHPYTRMLLDAVPSIARTRPTASAPTGNPARCAGTGLTAGTGPSTPAGSGCPFAARCPVGPLVHAERAVCLERDPRQGREQRVHAAACHFAAPR